MNFRKLPFLIFSLLPAAKLNKSVVHALRQFQTDHGNLSYGKTPRAMKEVAKADRHICVSIGAENLHPNDIIINCRMHMEALILSLRHGNLNW
jgi:hypothetical protein